MVATDDLSDGRRVATDSVRQLGVRETPTSHLSGKLREDRAMTWRWHALLLWSPLLRW